MIIAELVAALGFRLEGEADLRKFEAGLKGAETKLTAFAATVAKIGAVAGAALGAGLAALAKGVVSVSAEFEGFETALTTIEGSADKARQSMDWIAQFAVETPYEMAGVTDAFVRLKTYGIDPVDGTLRTLGDTASAMNKPLNAAVEALADAMTGQFERLKEFGIVASTKGDQVTFSWQKNGATVTKTVKKVGDEIKKFVLENLGDRFNGAMLRQSKTWNGMISNLQDSWSLFQLKIGHSGFFENVKNRLANLLDYIGELNRDGTLERWAKSLSNGLSSAADGAAQVIHNLKGDFEFLSKWVKVNPDLWDKIKNGLGIIGAVMFPKTAAVLLLDDVLNALQGKDSYIRDIAKSISEFLDVKVETATKWLSGFAVAGAGLAVAVGPMKALAGAIGILTTALQALAGAAVTRAIGILAGLGVFGVAAGAAAIAEFGPDVAKKARKPKEGEPLSWLGLDPTESREDRLKRIKSERDRPGSAAPKPDRGAAYQSYLDSKSGGGDPVANFMANWGKMTPAHAANAVVNDNHQDNRQYPVTVNSTVNQTVNQAVDAPGAAARATSSAVGRAAVPQAGRLAIDSAF